VRLGIALSALALIVTACAEPSSGAAGTTTSLAVTAPAAASSSSTTTVDATAPPPSTPAADLAAPPEPIPLGVYRYATTGAETIDVLGGERHDYPDATTITVTNEGCGRVLRWDVVAQRYEIWGICDGDDNPEFGAQAVQYHEFFGQKTPEPVDCDRTVPLVLAESVMQMCSLADREWNPTWTPEGERNLTINGVAVATLVWSMVVDDTDDFPERIDATWWFRSDGLPVRIEWDKWSVSENPLGGTVRYEEQFVIELLDNAPIR
jgi:hypothetical protein